MIMGAPHSPGCIQRFALRSRYPSKIKDRSPLPEPVPLVPRSPRALSLTHIQPSQCSLTQLSIAILKRCAALGHSSVQALLYFQALCTGTGAKPSGTPPAV